MNQMNLLPEYYVKQRFRNRVDMLCVILFTLVMGGVIAVGIVQGRTYRRTRANYESLCRQFDRETGSLDEFIRLRNRKRTLLTEARQVSALEESLPRSYVVALVARSLPDEAYLSVLEINEKINITAEMTQKSPGRRRKQVTRSSEAAQEEESPKPRLLVRIGGYAANDSDVATIYTRLKAHPITREVSLRHTREYESDTGLCREFQIDWELENGVDVLEHLTEEVGVVESPREDSTDQKEAG